MGIMRWIEHNPTTRRLGLKARQILGRAFMRASYYTGFRKNRIMFSSFRGIGYTDNPRYICDALHAVYPDAEIVWQFRKGRGDDAPDYVHRVRVHTLKSLYMISTARVLVDNFNRAHYMLKFPKQVYVQTWHGDRGFKKILYDAFPDTPFPDGEQMDLALAGSDFGEGIYRSAFRYAGDVLRKGLPRNDILIHPPEGLADRVRHKLGVQEGTKLLLYAPTFRDATRGKKQPCPFSMPDALKRLSEITGETWICLARGHEMNTGVGCAGAVDVSHYPEMAELLLVSDLLITDYSSSAGDFPLTGKPVILYQEDREKYRQKDRNMHFAMEDSPFWAATNEEEMYGFFARLDEAPKNCRAILEFYGVSETGYAAQAVAEYIANCMQSPLKGARTMDKRL